MSGGSERRSRGLSTTCTRAAVYYNCEEVEIRGGGGGGVIIVVIVIVIQKHDAFPGSPDIHGPVSCQVITMEQEPGEWGFKSLKQMMKLYFSMQQYGEMLKRYRQLLTDYTATGAVTQNVSEKGINR